MLHLLLIHGVGATGGYVARRLRIPAGAMIGAMAAVLLFNAVTGTAAVYPSLLRAVVQALSGALIGSRFAKSDVGELRQVLKPAGLLMVLLFGMNLLFAFFISATSQVSLITALFASAPGGVSDLALIAVDFGADTEAVTILQMFRFIFVVSFFPPFIKHKYMPDFSPETEKTPALEGKKRLLPERPVGRLLLPLAVAVGGGLLLRGLGIPAGAIIGAMVVIITFNLTREKVPLPEWLKTAVQVCCGSYIGNQVTRQALFSLGRLLLPMAFVLLEVMAMAFVSAWIIHRLTGLAWITCLFSSIPGGIAEMGLIAEEMKLDTPKIVVMHTCRVIMTICLMPVMVQLLNTP